jgi:aminoglycoside 6'-N-acetyltransferase
MVTDSHRGPTAVLTTERLVVRQFGPADLDAFVRYRSDPEDARYQAWDAPFPRHQANHVIASEHGGDLLRPGAWLQLAVADRRSGELHGDCAVHPVADQPATAEVGVTFARSSQGRGLATEALGAVVSWLFAEHALHRVFAHADERNEPVRRLLERLGFRREAAFVDADWFKDEWTTLLVYAVLAREWRHAARSR